MYIFSSVFLALKFSDDLAKLVGLILAMAIAFTGQVVDKLKR